MIIPSNGIPGGNLAGHRRGLLGVLVMALLTCPVAAQAARGERDGRLSPPTRSGSLVDKLPEEETPAAGAVPIVAPTLPPEPAEGNGRLSIVFSGNRRWCTFPDDRVVRPPGKLGALSRRKKGVYTFGYQFTIAAVKKSDPGTTLLLYESRVVRTARLKQALKMGRGKTPKNTSQMVDFEGGGPGLVRAPELPNTLLPYWMEKNRCARVGERFDFDLEPGTYDVYAAFDLLTRGGNWVHRSIGFETDVTVDRNRHTRLDGVIGMEGGGRRNVSFVGSSILSPGAVDSGTP